MNTPNQKGEAEPICHKYPLVSIIIPSYNHENFVTNCLDSVLRERYPNKEIVIINDGSKDNTEKVIHQWIERNKEKLPIYFKSRENRGICKTINELLDMSNGEYFIFLASDDELRNDGILKRFEYLQQNPDKKGVIGDSNVINDEGILIYNSLLADYCRVNKENYKTDEDLKREIVTNFCLLGSISMLRKDVFETVKYFDETIKQEDRDFYLKMVSKNYLGFLDEIVSAYRLHDTNTSRTKLLIGIQADTPKVLLKYFNVFKEYRVFIIKEILYIWVHLIYLRMKFYLLDKLNQKNSPKIFKKLYTILYNLKNRINETLCFVLQRKL